MKITQLEDQDLRQRIENRFSDCFFQTENGDNSSLVEKVHVKLCDVGAIVYFGNERFFATQRHTNPITGQTGQYYKCNESFENGREICYLNAEFIEVDDGNTDGICHSIVGNIIGYSRPTLGYLIQQFDRDILQRLYDRLDGRFPNEVFSCYENEIRGIESGSRFINQRYVDEEGTLWLN